MKHDLAVWKRSFCTQITILETLLEIRGMKLVRGKAPALSELVFNKAKYKVRDYYFGADMFDGPIFNFI